MRTAKRTMRVDYYTVEAHGQGSMVAVLRKINAIPNTSRRNRTLSTHPVRLDICKEHQKNGDTVFECDIIKIRMENLPIKAGTNGSKADLDFEPHEGVGEETAFLYSQKHNMLVMQSNRLGVTPNLFEAYVNHFADVGNSFELCPVISKDTLEKLSHASSLRNFTLRVHPAAGREYLRQCGASVSSAVTAMEEIGGESIEITVSVGRGKDKTLSLKTVRNMVHSLIRHNEDTSDINKLQTTADLDDEGLVPIDFLKDRIRFTDEIEYDADRRMSYTVRKKLVQRAWDFKDFQNLLK